MGHALDDLPVTQEELRSLVLEFLSTAPSGQIGNLVAGVAKSAVDKQFVSNPSGGPRVIGVETYSLSRADQARMQDVFWDLIIEGIIRPGLSDGLNNDLPFFHVTDYGRNVLKDGPPSAHDPDGYLKRLQSQVPDVDEVVVTYLEESLRTFRIGCLLSSTTALGCASEKALLLLVESYACSLPGDKQERFKRKTEGRAIKNQFDEFRKALQGHVLPLLPPGLKQDLDTVLLGIFSMIRNLRNEVGHPTGTKVSREVAHANLVVFPTYLKQVYGLICWFHQNTPLE